MPRLRGARVSRRSRRARVYGRTRTVGAYFASYPEVSRLRAEVSRLKKLAATQEMQIAELQQELDTTRATQPDEFIEIREISKEQAREEIIESFKSGEPLDHADLADALALEISLVVEVCSELMEEGVVVFYDDDWG